MSGDSEIEQRAQARVGATLRGKLRIDSVLGMGGMAVVYAATHRNAKRFAVKMLHPELSLNADIKTRFLREGYAANSVGHPGTVAVLDDDTAEDGTAFIVMELLEGDSVEGLWERQGGRLPVVTAVAIVDQLLDVLSAAHAKGIIHRDIKPANLFVTRDGSVKVLDFGIARAREAASGAAAGKGTGTGVLLGTPAYMAPEQAMAKSTEVDAQTDVWAAAATLFTVLSGQLVHLGDNASQLLIAAATQPARLLLSVAPHVPPSIAQVVDRGLAYHKPARWMSAADMRVALRHAYPSALGAFPERVPQLGQAVGATAFAATHLAPSEARAVPAATPPWTQPGGTTAQPVAAPTVPGPVDAIASAGAYAPVVGPKRSPVLALLAAGGGALALVGMGFGLRAMRAEREPDVSPAASASPPFVAAAVAPPVAPSVAALLPPAASTEARSQAHDAAKGPAVAVLPAKRPTAPPASAASPPPSPPTPVPTPPPPAPPPAHAAPGANCSPPFYFDAQGSKVFKKECL
jgi:tRNA A-37 threonylcarbamoyl transferase component Bud32